MKRVMFLLILVYASSILNITPELYAQKVEAGWVQTIIEKEKIEKEEKKEEEKEPKEKKEKTPKEKKEKTPKEIKDYTHSIGVAIGSSYGLAYKYFFMDNLALKADATWNMNRGEFEYFFANFEVNPNGKFTILTPNFENDKNIIETIATYIDDCAEMVLSH